MAEATTWSESKSLLACAYRSVSSQTQDTTETTKRVLSEPRAALQMTPPSQAKKNCQSQLSESHRQPEAYHDLVCDADGGYDRPTGKGTAVGPEHPNCTAN